MEQWLAFAKGPLFRFTFTLMLLGLLRLFILQVWGIVEAYLRASDKNVPMKSLLKTTFIWTFPVTRLHRIRPFHSFTSFFFHVGMILVPIFFDEHIGMWEKSVGRTWVGFSKTVADPLTLITIAAIITLFMMRVIDRNSRFMSDAFDYLILVLLFIPFTSGYLVSHPDMCPLPYNLMMLIHILSAEVILVLLPFTKLAHVALYATVRLSSDIAWRFVPDAGEKVAAALGREGRV
ncbi:MAG: hypothetical protein AB1546_02800 [bacterium]